MGKAIPYSKVQIVDRETVKVGDSTFDNFISNKGGIELATMIALAGTSGAGKTTLCKKFQRDLKKGEKSIFYSLESRKSSVARQTARIETGEDELICDVDDFPTWSSFIEYIYQEKPLMVIVDSLQHAAELLSKENGKFKYDNYKVVIKDLYDWKDKTEGISILIVQLNAQNQVEGPASTIFDVDVPIFLIADEKTGERTLSTKKNRMGQIGTINYEFVDSIESIKFYSKEEWKALKNDLDIISFVNEGIENFLSAYKNKPNFKTFKKEAIKEYKKICEVTDNDVEVLVKFIPIINQLAEKYFV